MSVFIVSSGLDLDSIFQLKPPAITDMNILYITINIIVVFVLGHRHR